MKKELGKAMNNYLSNINVMYTKLHNLHWNVIGVNFKSVHEFLETLYDGFSEAFDEIAELLKMHNEYPKASLKEYLETAEIKELPSKDYQVKETLEIVLADFELLKKQAEEIRTLADNENLYDIVSALEDNLKNYIKNIWFIKSMLK